MLLDLSRLKYMENIKIYIYIPENTSWRCGDALHKEYVYIFSCSNKEFRSSWRRVVETLNNGKTPSDEQWQKKP